MLKICITSCTKVALRRHFLLVPRYSRANHITSAPFSDLLHATGSMGITKEIIFTPRYTLCFLHPQPEDPQILSCKKIHLTWFIVSLPHVCLFIYISWCTFLFTKRYCFLGVACVWCEIKSSTLFFLVRSVYVVAGTLAQDGCNWLP
jgi:hypothetical protein